MPVPLLKDLQSQFAFFTFCAATIFLQIASIPLAQYAFAQKNGVESWILASLFFGMATGQFGWRTPRLSRALSFVCATLFFILSLFFSPALVFTIEHLPARVALVVALFLATFRLGQMIAESVYGKEETLVAYHKLNGGLALCVPLALLVLWGLGLHWLLGLTAVFLVWAECNLVTVPPPTNHRSDLRSIVLGFVSASYVALAFRLIYLCFFPTGLEFFLYLLTSLALLTFAARRAILSPLQFSSAAAALIGLLAFSALVFLISAEWKGSFLLPILKLGEFSHGLSQGLVILLSLAGIVIFLLPYYFFACLLPLRQKEIPGKNHLFSLTLGNALGFLFFSVLTRDTPLFWQLASLLALTGSVYLAGASSRRKLFVLTFAGVCFTMVPRDLERRLSHQAIAFQPSKKLAFLDKALPALNQPKVIKDVFLNQGDVGYVAEFGGQIRKLGLGGYGAWMNDPLDLMRGHKAAEYVTNKSKVLVLGYGNQLALSILAKKNPARLDVVDNFAPFLDSRFVDKILPRRPNRINFYYDDALPFVAARPEEYDLIVWNLTWPSYFSARKLYSEEFVAFVKKALRPAGVFVGESYQNPDFDCRIRRNFSYVDFPFPLGKENRSIFSAANTPGLIPADSRPAVDCSKTNRITLAQPLGVNSKSNFLGLPIGVARAAPYLTPPFRAPYGEGIAGVFGLVQQPYFLALRGQTAQLIEPILRAHRTHAYVLQPPTWLDDSQIEQHALILGIYNPQLKYVTDQAPEQLPSAVENFIPPEQFISLRSEPRKGVRSIWDLRNALVAISQSLSAGEKPAAWRLKSGAPPKLASEAELLAQLEQNIYATGEQWQLEIAETSAAWPETKGKLLRILLRPEKHPVLPKSANHFLLPLFDPQADCVPAGYQPRTVSAEAMAFAFALSQPNPWGPSPEEILYWRGGKTARRMGAKFRYSCFSFNGPPGEKARPTALGNR